MTDLTSLKEIQSAKKGLYAVRTRHRNEQDEPLYINELIKENSPYLLQHAHNPVNWHSWSQETLDLARVQDKPIFLSIGYATCHWCHVMEEESFDDMEVAQLLNDGFIAIKIDREQHPDLDDIYMTAVQIVSGHGGWPMSCLLTSDAHPFFGGTYYPKTQFIDLLKRVTKLWHQERDNLLEQGYRISTAIKKYLQPKPVSQEIDDHVIEQAIDNLLKMADADHGGFGEAPKFPQESSLLFLIDHIARQPHALSQQPEWHVTKLALDRMLQGGIYDQLAGGFHRYSVDQYWCVPHFEKMLYNQGQLVRVYTQAFKLSGNPEYRRVATETLDFCLEELRNDTGLFYSAMDADSEGEEGKYYVWTREQLEQKLTDDEYAFFTKIHPIQSFGNFEGCNVLVLKNSHIEYAKQLQMTYPELQEKLKVLKKKLVAKRAQRIPPLTDTKVITEWNGMLIAALAEAGRILSESRYIDAASVGIDQLWKRHRTPEGQLLRMSVNGQATDRALLEDYAHLMDALIQLYDATREHIYLERCQSLLSDLQQFYWDTESGGFFCQPRIRKTLTGQKQDTSG